MNKIFKPSWKQGKNKFIKYETRYFDDKFGHTAYITYALYIDKNNEHQECVAWVKWIKQENIMGYYSDFCLSIDKDSPEKPTKIGRAHV